MMIKSLALISALSTLFTLPCHMAAASQSLNTGKIVCIETGTDSDSHVSTKIGEITVALDNKGNPRQIQISRQGHADVPTINKTFDVKTSSVKNEIVSAVGIKKVQMISANDSDRRSLVLRINDQNHSGKPGSSFTYAYGKMEVSSIEETTVVSCQGQLQVPWNSPASVALDQQPKKLLNK